MSTESGHLDVTADQPRRDVSSPAVVTRIRPISSDVRGLILAVEDKKFAFHPGQWVDFIIDNADLVGGYSICSSPRQLRDAGTLELAVKRSTCPPAVWVHTQCQVGSRVTLRAGGAFWYGPAASEPTRPLLLVAGGVGITPLMSIMQHCAGLRREGRPAAPSRLALLYTAKSENALLFKDRIRGMQAGDWMMADLFITAKDNSSQDPQCFRRRMTCGDLGAAVRWLGEPPDCYVCGPSVMVSDVERWLLELGVPSNSVRHERWW